MKKNEIIDYLKGWNDSVSDIYLNSFKTNSRRDFLKQLALGSTAVIFSNHVLANTKDLSDNIWLTFSTLHLHLFPIASNSPDAKTINATAYLKSITEWPGVDDSDKQFILNGIGWLDGVSIKSYNKPFRELSNKQRETVLRLVENSQAGENWLSLVLLYLMEALLTDPVYGANTNGVGWKWLEHQPGFPHPSANKRYFEL